MGEEANPADASSGVLILSRSQITDANHCGIEAVYCRCAGQKFVGMQIHRIE